MWNDADLQLDIEKELRWEPSARLTLIRVIVKNGVVELSGHVDSYWEKCAAENAAWRVVHVACVANEIHVEVPFADQRADDDIALAAMSCLEWNVLVPATVDVQVADAWITLSGAVERQHQKEEAERALRTLKAIRGIRNQIVVQPPPGESDVRPQIEAALKRNALVDSNHIKTHVAHGVVSLRGTARSRAERDQAIEAAWAAPGVTNVDDHIAIGHA